MIVISIIINIVAKALPVLNTHISSPYFPKELNNFILKLILFNCNILILSIIYKYSEILFLDKLNTFLISFLIFFFISHFIRSMPFISTYNFQHKTQISSNSNAANAAAKNLKLEETANPGCKKEVIVIIINRFNNKSVLNTKPQTNKVTSSSYLRLQQQLPTVMNLLINTFINTCLISIVFIILEGYFDLNLIGYIYCDGGDGDPVQSSNNNITEKSSCAATPEIGKSLNTATNTETTPNLTSVPQATNSNIDDKYYKLNKQLVDKVIEKADQIANQVVDKAIPTIGGYAAGGAFATAMLKTLPSTMSTVSKIGISAGGGGVVAGAVKLGLGVGDVVLEQTGIKKEIKNTVIESIKNSSHANPEIGRVPSPGNDFIPSLLDINELKSPLEKLLNYQILTEIFILILILILLFVIFNKFIVKYNLEFIQIFINKYTSSNFKERFNKYIIYSNNINNKFLTIMFIFITIFLFYFIFLSLYITSEILFNLDDYIEVHNYLKNLK